MGKGARHKQNVKRLLSGMAAKVGQRPPKTLPAPAPPSRFNANYGTGVLLTNGPLVVAKWHVPGALEDALRSAGNPVPRPVVGVLLLDTGASGTCVSIKAAEALGLTALRIAHGYGSGGDTYNPVYFGRLEIPITDANSGVSTQIFLEQEVQGIPKLEKHTEATGLTYAGARVDLIGLLGRDVLQHTRFSYDGLLGVLELDFDRKAIGLV